MKFEKEFLSELVCFYANDAYDAFEDFTVIQNELTGSSRWSKHFELIFKDNKTNKFYSSSYSRGATECQDERPYEHEGNEIECVEVVPKEVITIVYEKA